MVGSSLSAFDHNPVHYHPQNRRETSYLAGWTPPTEEPWQRVTGRVAAGANTVMIAHLRPGDLAVPEAVENCISARSGWVQCPDPDSGRRRALRLPARGFIVTPGPTPITLRKGPHGNHYEEGRWDE